MKTKRINFKKVLLIICLFICFLFASFFIFFGFLYNKYNLDVNKLTSLNNGIKVYSATGTDSTLYNTNRSIIELNSLPEYVPNAFISVEDKRFYSHNGYDLKRIIKAGFVNFTTKSKSQGASTISQQLIKNALLTNEKTYSRKIKEVILSIKMEKMFTKQEILEMYLNTIYFGSNAYGIENASLTYFNKSAKDLTLNEACCLAGIIKSPNIYSPKKSLDNAIKRKNLVANLMLSSNHITENEYKNILEEKLNIHNNSTYNQSYEEEAIFETCSLLNITERELINKKYQIITFKDDEVQNELIKINNKVIKDAENNNNCDLDSLSIITKNNGQVIAYYANSNYNLHNLTRQPASTLKPLAVYLPNIAHNMLTSVTPIVDEAINYNGFAPKNADGKFSGVVSAKTALANSLNIPSVKLLDNVGLKKSKETLEKLGINITNSDMNLSLALGSTKNGVNLLRLTNAYSTLANLGVYKPMSFVNKILDENNNVIYSKEDYFEQILKEDDCFLLNDMLKETAVSGTAKRLNDLNLPLCSKTGTAGTDSGNTDLYNITYSSEHTVLTWVADINKTYLPSNLLSSSQPTDINKEVCKYLYKNTKPNDFIKPDNVEKMPYSVIELEKNKIVMFPAENELERYIGYAYFKLDNPPCENISPNIIDLSVVINKNGVNLQFNAQKNKVYNVFRIIDNKKDLIATIKEESKNINLTDYNVFKHTQIQYFIEDEAGNVISQISKVNPKDYLVGLLNKELNSTKKKWLV